MTIEQARRLLAYEERLDELLAEVAHVLGFQADEIAAPHKPQHIVYARAVFFHLARKIDGVSLSQIAAKVSRDHSVVVYALAKIDNGDAGYCMALQKYNDLRDASG